MLPREMAERGRDRIGSDDAGHLDGAPDVNVCGHPYRSQIRWKVSQCGQRSPASISRSSRIAQMTKTMPIARSQRDHAT
jgi:hypothetical protein